MRLRFPTPLLVLSASVLLACSPPPAPQGPTAAPSGAFAPPDAASTPRAPTPPPTRVDASLLPRSLFFGNPDRASARISPDGKRIAFLAPLAGVLNVWVGPAEDIARAKPVTTDKKRGIRRFFFAYAPDHLLYLKDAGGDENWHVFDVDLGTGTTKELTPGEKVRAEIQHLSPRTPYEIAVSTNERDPEVMDLRRLDLRTGKSTLLFENKERFIGFEVDDDLRPRVADRVNAAGEKELVALDGDKTVSLFKVGVDDQLTTSTVGVDESGKTLYLEDSRGRDTSALVALDLATKKTTVLATDDKADIVNVLTHPRTGRPQAVASDPGRRAWRALDRDVAETLAALTKNERRDVDPISRTLDDKKWIVRYEADDGPTEYVLYDRVAKKATSLFVDRQDLVGKPLASMQLATIRSRDGLEMPAYLTMPKGVTSGPLPTVLWVHGGPWSRDEWGYQPFHQLFASRGYAVLSVNYRGSTGFGKRFVNAANREWYGKMHDDLLDAVAWAVEKRIADPSRVAIVGGSYGGYAALAGLTKTPDTFACGVDLVGISSLVTWIDTFPPYWKPFMGQIVARVGDPTTDAGRQDLLARSPLTHASAIKKPLLIAQGKNDPRVKEAESRQIVEVVQKNSVPVTYLVYDDEGHGFARPENWLSFDAVTETFLAQCLGGPRQPYGTDLRGSSMRVVAGADRIDGLAEAVAKP